MALAFFEVKDIPELKVIRFRRLSGPKDSAGNVVYIDDAKLTGAGVTAIKTIPFSDKITVPTGLENSVLYEISYKAPPPQVLPTTPPTGKKVGDAVTVASLFGFTDSQEADYTITADPAASADLTTTPGSVILKATGNVKITAQHKTVTTAKASVDIAVA